MEFPTFIQPAMTNEITFEVEAQHSASQIGSGALRVLATPAMIAFMENTSHRLLAERMPAGYSSVGVLVNVQHLAPTPVGAKVRIYSEVLSVEGARVTFNVQAWDESEQIGSGQHQRIIIDEARFLRRVSAKTEQIKR